ncbi:MAG TPA: hypothetical protein VGE21_06300 [Flavobacteriales bacterium]
MIPANEEQLHQVLIGQAQVLAEARGILAENERRDRLAASLLLGSRARGLNHVPDPEPERVMHLPDIKALCVGHRLRFLEACHYKGVVPNQAVHALRRLEKVTGKPLRSFRILAPTSAFRRSGARGHNWLLIPLGEQRFYIVHDWGPSNMAWRTLRYWPLRSPLHLLAGALVLATMLAAGVPGTWIGAATDAGWWGMHRLLAGLWAGALTAAVISFCWFAFRGRFNGDGWNGRKLF